MNRNVSEFDVKNTIESARVYAFSNGILKRLMGENNEYITTNLPFTLVPTIFPHRLYENGLSMQTIINELYCGIVQNSIFIKDVFENVSSNDPFIHKLYQIYLNLLGKEIKQELQLALIRTDYLINESHKDAKKELKQVEVNCIAASFGGIAPKISRLHQFTLSQNEDIVKTSAKPPLNDSLKVLSDGLCNAWKNYGKARSIIVFVVEKFTSNEFDQRFLEWEILQKEPQLQIKRYTFADLAEKAKVDPINAILTICGEEVAVVYYRTGYGPSDYPDEKAWEVRELIEGSMAIKCPTIQFQLAGTKKVQERLSDPLILAKFLYRDKCAILRTTFAKFYPVDGEDAERNIDYAIENYDDLVLKPLREGGGHNLYGQDIKTFLTNYKKFRSGQITHEDSDPHHFPLDLPFVLMEKIKPPSQLNYIIKTGERAMTPQDYQPVPIVSELGIFGTILCSESKGCIESQVGGYLLRSKPVHANETGIVAGFGALDSLLLE